MIRYACLLTAAAFASGCGGKPPKLDTEDPDKYALQIKTQVYRFVGAVSRAPRTAAEQGSVLLEELEVYQKQPVGAHGNTYAQLLQACKELVDAANRPAEVGKKLKEMKALADTLPGEVPPDTSDAPPDRGS